MYRAPYEAISIIGRTQKQFALSTTPSASGALPEGVYDVWATADVYLAVGDSNGTVSTTTGYLIRVGNTVPILVPAGLQIWGIAASGTGTCSCFLVDGAMRARQVSVLQPSGSAGSRVWSGVATTDSQGRWAVDYTAAGFTQTPIVIAQAIAAGTNANQAATANVVARSQTAASGTVTVPALAVLGVLSVGLAPANAQVQVIVSGT